MMKSIDLNHDRKIIMDGSWITYDFLDTGKSYYTAHTNAQNITIFTQIIADIEFCDV